MAKRRRAGQSIAEVVLILPLFLFFAFGVLQMGQLGTAVLMANYAASSVARKMVSDQTFNMSLYQKKASALMVAGMQLDSENDGLKYCIDKDPGTPTQNLTVAVRTKIAAWPFFGDIVHGAIHSTYDVAPLTCADLADAGFFNFSGQAPYYFYVTGKAKVRLNYVPS